MPAYMPEMCRQQTPEIKLGSEFAAQVATNNSRKTNYRLVHGSMDTPMK